jgi:site-specific recombinase XerD
LSFARFWGNMYTKMYTKTEAGMTVAVILHKGRKNKAGDYPLYLRITQNGKRIYKATGIAVRERDWNRRRNEPTASCPNREEIMLLIATIKKRVIEDITKRYEEEAVVRVKSNKPGSRMVSLMGRHYSLTKRKRGVMKLKEYVALVQTQRQRELICLFDDYIQQLKENGELEYISGLTAAKDAFAKVNLFISEIKDWDGKEIPLHISEITKERLRDTDGAMLKSGVNKTTVDGYMAALRMVYDYAIEKGLAFREDYPFPYRKIIDPALAHISKEAEVAGLFDDYIQQKKKEGSPLKSLSALNTAKNAFAKVNSGLNFPISEITTEWLRKAEKALLNGGVNKTTIGIYMRSLRTIYNIAIEKKLVSQEDYPFGKGGV